MASHPDVFRVRLNCVDHYQHSPCSLDAPLFGSHSFSTTQRNGLPQVPVIRVFGATETGQKVCAHIHGAFPYLFVPYEGSIEDKQVHAYIAAFRSAIDSALTLSYRRNPHDDPSRAIFVAHISLVKGVPFFGYNVGYRYFLKIYLLNPLHMTRFSDLLQQGAIMKQQFQPYEAHLQYLLQWMCDFNLYGCAYIEAKNVRFRSPIPAWDDLDDVDHLWHDRSISADSMLDHELFTRQSHCQLELDIRVENIMNRLSMEERPLHHSFVERLASLENLPIEEKLVHSMKGLWKDETRRRRKQMGLSDDSSSPFPPEVLVSMSVDPRNTSDGGWIHEAEFRRMVAELAAQEKRARGGGDLSFETFGKQNNQDDGVQTVWESVADLFTSTMTARWSTKQKLQATQRLDEMIANQTQLQARTASDSSGSLTPDDIDVNAIEDENGYGSDEEKAKEMILTQRRKSAAASGQEESARHTESLFDAAERKAAAFSAGNPLKRTAPMGVHSPSKKSKFSDIIAPNQKLSLVVPDGRTAKSVLPIRSPTSPSDQPPPGAQPQKVFERGRSEDYLPPPSAQPPASQPSPSASQGPKIAFPVVKNPRDPATILRLSQHGNPSQASQKSLPNASQKSAAGSLGSLVKSGSQSTLTSPVNDRPTVDRALAENYCKAFPVSRSTNVLVYSIAPVLTVEVERTLVPSVIYQDAYYSDEKDVPERPREYAGQEFKLLSRTLPYLPRFNATGIEESVKANDYDKQLIKSTARERSRKCTLRRWEIMAPPPTWTEVELWLKHDKHNGDKAAKCSSFQQTSSQLKRKNKPDHELSQIEGLTQKNKHGFKYSQKRASTSVQHETGYMSIMSLETHINSRDDLAPDPERDEVNMVVWCIADEQADENFKMGIVVLAQEDDVDRVEKIRRTVGANVEVEAEESELDLLNRMVDIVREYDPDVLTGYEVHNNSWGYLIERARLQYEFNLPDEFSRMKSQSHGRFGKDSDRWGFNHTSTVRITGRHTINIWRAMRSELNLLQYTMENVVFHLLQRRIPHYSYASLTKWYRSKRPKDLAKVLDYFVSRTKLDLDILDANELIPRTSEQARLLGVDFFSVFSRGSQFKVESLMFRIAKPESFILVSPSRKQVGAQNALECLPLVMEPQSAFYSSPLLVLDFQSLYPSVMIAYNYCYSTCLGRITNWRGTNKLGFADFRRAPGLLELVQDKLNIAPNGMMYVRPEMRKSLLAKMLGEILETRVMVKSGMKVDKDDKALQQLLNNRQLALKLIANVTYGYTSASFSGRMPCSEIADSIVQTGRETLEKAIALIHSVERWGAEVVYGDTDSLFVYLKGRTRDDAFKIGNEIAKAVTDVNPRPIKLKFEKVYHPCVLLAKKRYVGFKYESANQTEPEFDAKGIETVRRDGTPAEQKIEEKALKLLFRSADLSQVKSYFQAQCTKIMSGRVSIQDFCFAKEVKLGTYADKGPPPPGALIATKRMLRDPRAEPQYGERIPYVVMAGAPGARLWERCVEPERLLHDAHAELDAEYYINKNIIPPLERIFNLVGANVRSWYDEMPKVQRIRMLGGPSLGGDVTTGAGKNPKRTMESYMGSSHCLVCRTKLTPVQQQQQTSAFAGEVELPLCETCRHTKTSTTIFTLRRRLQKAETRVREIVSVCRSCADVSFDEPVLCDSRDCPVFYSRVKANTLLDVARTGTGRVLETLEGETLRREGLEW
jgi:DNA polymerase zeta